MSAPFIISKPQFLDADEKLQRNIDGLNPNRDEHDIFLHLEMVSVISFSKWNEDIFFFFF